MPTGFPSLVQAKELLSARLSRRITLLVCLSILVVELLFLLPSYFNRRVELREHDEQGVLLAASGALGWYELHTPAEMLKQTWDTLEQFSIEGIAVYAENGGLLASHGLRPDLQPNPDRTQALRSIARQEEPTVRTFPDSGDYYEVLWPPVVSGLPFSVAARISTAEIDAELHAYVLRIAGLVLVLSLIVSACTVAVLGRTVLTPILAIHRNLTAAHSDPVNAEKYKLDIEADNEIGETVTALNALLGRLSEVRRSHVREREERFRDFAASSSDWFWEMDEKLRFCFFSDLYTSVTGVAPDKLLGKTREETGIPNVDPTEWEQHLGDLQAHRPFRNFSHPRQRPDGETVWLSINGNPVFDQNGDFRGYRGTGRDITEQVVTQEALRTAKEEAETANRTKSEFLANVSHELRTPLNAIIGFSEVMMHSEPPPGANPQHRGYLEDIHNSGLHLLSLINDILDLSKIEAGADELEEENINVAETAHAVLRVVRQRAENSGLTIDHDDRGPLPLLRADERKLKQVLLNLLANAIKFTPAGGKIEFSIWCSQDDGYAFRIADNGIGMAQEDIPTAMHHFGQIDSALNRRYEGTGLGLPLTKALVELHGGTLDLQSKLGEGTAVTIRLPAWRILASEERRDERASV